MRNRYGSFLRLVCWKRVHWSIYVWGSETLEVGSIEVLPFIYVWGFETSGILITQSTNMEKSLKRRWQLLRLLKLYLEKMMKFSGENYSILEFWSWLLYIWRYVTFDITYIKSWTWDRRRKTWTTLSISKFCS